MWWKAKYEGLEISIPLEISPSFQAALVSWALPYREDRLGLPLLLQLVYSPGPSSKKLPRANFCLMDSRSFFWACREGTAPHQPPGRDTGEDEVLGRDSRG